MKRGLVVSGGGFLGAYAGGLIEFLIKEKKLKWDVYAGTSAGSLVTTGVALSDIDRFKEMYLNIEEKDIFKPFTFLFNKLNIFNIIYRFIFGYSSISNSKKLRKLLGNLIIESDYKKNKVISCASNYNTGQSEFHTNLDTDYNKFLDYVWASTSIPVVFEPVKIDFQYYFDGGVINNIPIQSLIDENCDEIDIIILKHKENIDLKWKPKNIVKVLSRTLSILLDNQANLNVMVSTLVLKKNVKLNIYYIPNTIDDSGILSTEKVKTWWQEGYDFLKNNKKLTMKLTKTTVE